MDTLYDVFDQLRRDRIEHQALLNTGRDHLQMFLRILKANQLITGDEQDSAAELSFQIFNEELRTVLESDKQFKKGGVVTYLISRNIDDEFQSIQTVATLEFDQLGNILTEEFRHLGNIYVRYLALVYKGITANVAKFTLK